MAQSRMGHDRTRIGWVFRRGLSPDLQNVLAA
jgi:hypothetical protein